MKKRYFTILGVVILSVGVIAFKAKAQAPFLTVIGFARMADGLGRQCPDMIEALHEDFTIGFIPLAPTVAQDIPSSIASIINKPNSLQGKVVFFNDNPWRPSRFWNPRGAVQAFNKPKHKDQIRICYTMLESTRIPLPWVESLNTYFDLVAVPDPFLEKVFKDSGVTIPIFTLPLGLNLKPYLDVPIKTAYNPIFRFACLGLLGERKNQIKLIKAFDLAFNKNPQIELVIHARSCNQAYKKTFLDVLITLNNPMIRFDEEVLDNASYQKLFTSIDMLVNVSKGEGFSIQPREAMALGIPVLISQNTAQETLSHSAYTINLKTPHKAPCYYGRLKQFAGEWFDFDVEELAITLQEAYAQKELLLKHNMQNKAYAETFDYAHIKDSYRALITPKKILLSDKNSITQEGLETTSKELIEKYTRLTGAL